MYLLRGRTHRYRGELQLAFADFDTALKFVPNFVAAFAEKGLTYEKSGDIKNAEAQFRGALNSPDHSYTDTRDDALATARSHLAALQSDTIPPIIRNAPTITLSTTSIATPNATVPNVGVPSGGAVPVISSGRRIALVIGNSAYTNVPALPNPQKDATAIAQSLRNIGFDVVTLANDLTHEKMIAALRDFANEAENSDWAMVYYAGHGMEVGGINYLIPVDAKIAVDRDIQFEAIPLAQVLNATGAAKKIKLVMLDACRDNPFTPRKTEAPDVIASVSTAGAPIATRSTNGRGLAEVKVTGATLVVYAAKDGQVALDGEGGNSPFAVALIQRLATPGVEINKIFRLVRDDVMEATAGRQEPFTYGSLPGKEGFFFVAK